MCVLFYLQKSQKKQNTQLYVVLYNFKGKEKDDLDLRYLDLRVMPYVSVFEC